MASRTVAFFLLSFVLAAALPIRHIHSSEEPELGRNDSRPRLVRDYSAGKIVLGKGDTNITSELSTGKTVGVVWLVIIAVLGLGSSAALYVARSRVQKSMDMLEMIPRVEKIDDESRTGSDGEGDDHPTLPREDEDLLGESAEHDEASTTSDLDLIILSESDEDATEDLICFKDDGEVEGGSSADEIPDVNREPLELPVARDLVTVSPSEGVPLTPLVDKPTLPDSPNPWTVPIASKVLESPDLLPILVEVHGLPVQDETPFATPISSPMSSPSRTLVCLDDEPVMEERLWTGLDLALLMQLRPGHGEVVWMLRLLMGVFGWIGVLLIR